MRTDVALCRAIPEKPSVTQISLGTTGGLNSFSVECQGANYPSRLGDGCHAEHHSITYSTVTLFHSSHHFFFFTVVPDPNTFVEVYTAKRT